VAYVTSTTSAGVASASRSLAVRLVGYLQREMLLRNRPTRASAYAARSLATGFGLTILYGSQAELNGRGAGLCLPGSGKTVNGTVAGVNAAQAQSASISLGPSTTSATPAGTFQLTDVPDGALDLVAARSTTNTTTFSTSVDKMIDPPRRERREQLDVAGAGLRLVGGVRPRAGEPHDREPRRTLCGHELLHRGRFWSGRLTVGASNLPSAGPFTPRRAGSRLLLATRARAVFPYHDARSGTNSPRCTSATRPIAR
jgi:hypothetical protein